MASGSQKVFASVKSFSQRGKLLSRSDLQTLAESRDLDELITRIKNTNYSEAVSKISKPIVVIFDGLSRIILRWLQIPEESAGALSNSELEMLFDEASRKETITTQEQRIASNIMRFSETTASSCF